MLTWRVFAEPVTYIKILPNPRYCTVSGLGLGGIKNFHIMITINMTLPYVTRFAKRGLIHAQLQVSLFTAIRQIQQ